MPSKLDQLRSGQAVEIEPGVSGRLNREKKTLELSTGQVLNVSKDRDYFPENEKQTSLSRQKEFVEKGAKGTGGEFFHQFSNQGLVGSARDIGAYLTQAGDEYATKKQAEQEVSQRISQESPYTSAAATGASLVTDLATTRGMSAVKAAPLLTSGSAGSRVFTEPENVIGETAASAGLGFGIDKVGNYLSGVAKRRGQVRNLPIEQENVRKSNILGKAAVDESNLQQKQAFNALSQDVKQQNSALLRQHELSLNDRKNRIIENQNRAAVSQAEQAAFDAERKLYQQELKRLPEMQRAAQKEYAENVVRNAKNIESAFPEGSRVYSSQIGVNDFIDENISKSGLAGSREASQAARILKSIFPEGEFTTAKSLSTKYRALEDAIQRSPAEVNSVLSQFKNYLGEKLPQILTDNMAYARVIPSLKGQIEKEVEAVIRQMALPATGLGSRSQLLATAKNNINSLVREITPEDFLNRFRTGQLRSDIIEKVLGKNDFANTFSSLKQLGKARKSGMALPEERLASMGINIQDPASDKLNLFKNEFGRRLDKSLSQAELKLIATDIDAARKLGNKAAGTQGMAAPVTPPPAPVAPTPVQNAPVPPIPASPALHPEPVAPMQQSFNPQMEPSLAPAQGMAERSGDFLEKNLLGGTDIVNNPLTKLAGLKYLLGSAAVPAEAAYLGMKGLTSPNAAGEAARAGFKQIGIAAIEQMASKYPSYRAGILDDPRERRSLNKEIEDDQEIPPEEKAMIQSQINRGKPFTQRLQ